MTRLSQFVVVLGLLMCARQRLDPQAAEGTAKLSPYDMEMADQIQELFGMMNWVQREIKGSFTGIYAQLTELKAIAPRLDALEALLVEVNAEVESLSQNVTELSDQQNYRMIELCRTRPMGMSTGVIPNSDVTASSEFSSAWQAGYGRLGWYGGSWIPRTRDNHWLQINLGQESLVFGVITNGRHEYNQWVKTYKLSFSMDGDNWTVYSDSDGSDKVFQGNVDRYSPVTNVLDPPVTTQYVRFLTLTYQAHPVMRVEILGCPTDWL